MAATSPTVTKRASQADISPAGTRCCAFCLTPDAKMFCGGCRKRAYCSSACQKADWGKGFGQRHKLWCGLPCGEEGFDWEVKFISPERGMGLVAKRAFAADERVLVERVFTAPELAGGSAVPEPIRAAFMQLAPEGGSALQKLNTNCIGVTELGSGSESAPAVGMRLSRVNHACRPNADWWFDDTDVPQQTALLITNSPVAAGQEFTISYASATNMTRAAKSPELVAMLLRDKWGIRCPAQCACKDTGLIAKCAKARQMDAQIFELGSTGREAQAFRMAQELLALLREIREPKLQQMRTMYDCFTMGIVGQATLPEAEKIIKELHATALKLLGPHAQQTQRYGKLAQDPSQHPNHIASTAAGDCSVQ